MSALRRPLGACVLATLEQVRDLQAQPWVFAAFTEDEVRRVRLH